MLGHMSLSAANTKIQSGGDEPKSPREVKRSPECPKWEHAVAQELDQL